MKNRTIKEQLELIKKTKKIGLMTHVVIGYPTEKDTITIVKEMAAAGTDFVELQIPFSDPLADGPVIMKANDRALENGLTLEKCFQVMSKASKEVEIPLLFMGYYNSVFRCGVENFCYRAKEAGAAGLIIPDVPADEEVAEGFMAACDKVGLHHIQLLSPNSTNERVALNAKYQNGFVYCTSRAGITGATKELDPGLSKFLKKAHQQIHVPLAVGFGISQPAHIKALIGYADIAVVGSAVIEQIETAGVQSVRPFIEKLLKGTQEK
jgi:tryptophan synthase alpha chain